MLKIKSLFSCLCLILLTFSCVEEAKGQENTGNDLSLNSEAFYFEKIKVNQDKEALDKFLSTLAENYQYFTPSGQNVRLRTGPGVEYQAYKKTLSKNVKWRGYDYGETWFAGIVSTKEIEGDNQCSAWQEVMLIEFFYESWSTFSRPIGYNKLDGTDEMKPAYVCKDFISTSPLKAEHKKEFSRVYYTY